MVEESGNEVRRGGEAGQDPLNLLAKVVANAPIVLFAIDGDGIFTLSEGKALEDLGLEPGEVVGASVFDVYATEPDVLMSIRRALEGEDFIAEVRAAGRLYQTHFYPMFAGDEVTGVVGVALDITEKQMREAEQTRLSKLESLGLLAGGIAHDFNNLLSAIGINIELALAADREPGRANLADAAREVDAARDLTRQLMLFARGGVPAVGATDVAQVVGDSAAFALANSSVDWELHFDPGLWQAFADAAQLRQVVSNLLINAAQSMAEGGTVTVRGENVELGPDAPEAHPNLESGRYVKLIVEDQGPGIAPDLIDRIFDPYFTTKSDGTGLGLATAQSIVASHGGRISVSSERGTGAVFVVHLPAASPAAGREGGETAEPAADPGSGAIDRVASDRPAPRVLVMDDEPGVRDVLRLALGGAGYRIDLAREGREVLDLFRQAMEEDDPYAVVILDLEVGSGMGGLEALSKVLEIDPDARVVVASGHTRDPAVADYAAHGFAGALAKPFTVSELRRVIASVSS